MPLMQIHHQWINKGKTVKTEMIAQQEINDQNALKIWSKEIAKEHPLPEGAIWLWCFENSQYFVKMAYRGTK